MAALASAAFLRGLVGGLLGPYTGTATIPLPPPPASLGLYRTHLSLSPSSPALAATCLVSAVLPSLQKQDRYTPGLYNGSSALAAFLAFVPFRTFLPGKCSGPLVRVPGIPFLDSSPRGCCSLLSLLLFLHKLPRTRKNFVSRSHAVSKFDHRYTYRSE